MTAHPSERNLDGQDQIEDLNGHSIDDLSDYLDRGEYPPDLSIDDSVDCQIAMQSLRRLRAMSDTALEDEARVEPERDDSWVITILENISREARAGRSIPIVHDAPTADLSVTEGAIRGMIRRAGDEVGGILIGKCRLEGDVTTPGEPIEVWINASIFWGENIPETASRVRDAIFRELHHHTDLNITNVNVTVTDVHTPTDDEAE